MNQLTTRDKKKSKKIWGYVVVIVLVVAVIIGQNLYWKRQLSAIESGVPLTVKTEDNSKITVDSQTLMSAMTKADKLVTYEYYYTDAGTYEKGKKLFKTNIAIPFTTDKAVFTYGGSLGVGIHTEQLSIDTDNEKKIILVKIPPLEILTDTPDYDAFQYYDVKNSVFTSSNLKDFSGFQKELAKEQKEKLKKNEEFWKSARKNTEMVIENMLTASGNLDGYKIQFEWQQAS